MGLSILTDSISWAKYQAYVASENGITVDNVAWGNGPKAFPCMAVTYCPTLRLGEARTFVTCFVYEHEALELIKTAAAMRVYANKQDSSGAFLTETPSHKQAANTAEFIEKQETFNRWVAAMFLAMSYYMRETGIAKPDDFEQKIMQGQVLVDEVATEARDKIDSYNDLHAQDRKMLDRLFPCE